MVDRLANTEINARRISHVETCFGSSGKSLANPSRVLVGEGVLTKLCRKKPKQRQFFLFNDIIVYGNIVIAKKRYNKQHILNLKHVRVEEIPDTSSAVEVNDGNDLRNGWLIISPSKTFAVYAQTPMEKQEWMTHMNRCIEEERRKAGLDGNVLESAPAWVPDAEAEECMRCHKTHFSTIQRRHHCRKCGYVVCNSCSSNKAIIQHQSAKPLRVCDVCYNVVTNPSSISAPSGNTTSAAIFSMPRQIGAIADSSDSDDGNDTNP